MAVPSRWLRHSNCTSMEEIRMLRKNLLSDAGLNTASNVLFTRSRLQVIVCTLNSCPPSQIAGDALQPTIILPSAASTTQHPNHIYLPSTTPHHSSPSQPLLPSPSQPRAHDPLSGLLAPALQVAPVAFSRFGPGPGGRIRHSLVRHSLVRHGLDRAEAQCNVN